MAFESGLGLLAVATAIGPTAVAGGQTIVGPFTPPIGATQHVFTFDCSAWSGTSLAFVIESSSNGGLVFVPEAAFPITGGATAFTRNPAKTVGPSIRGLPPATAQTRIRLRITADGAFASAGGSYLGT